MATHLRAIDKEFEEADDTGVLVLSGRNLRQFPTVPGELLDFADVFEADFSKNRFDRLPKELIQFKALTKLNCYHNSLRYIPEELSVLVNLKHVNFSRNYLQSIPPELCKMNLFSLNLSNNRLVSLPVELGKLSSLQFLGLSCNLLQELPSSFCELKSLQRVDLHRNELKDLPEGISNLEQLEYLDVSSNQLSRLRAGLKDLTTLQTFIVTDNPLESPPMQVCSRGFGHIIKYLEYVAKRGSDPLLLSMNHRDESLRRRKERVNKRNSAGSRASTVSSITSMHNGKENSLFDEMTNFVNQAFGNGKSDGELTPTGTMHWSVKQYATSTPERALSDQSKEEYREAAHRLYMEERQRAKSMGQRSSSPQPSSSTAKEFSADGSTHYNTLPKRKSTENMFAASGGGGGGGGGSGEPATRQPRTLPGEKHRSGSWNTHNRISSPVLPSKYQLGPERQRSDDGKDSPGRRPQNPQSRSATDLHIVTADKSLAPKQSPEKKKKPPPLEPPKQGTVQHDSPSRRAGDGGGDSDREGSITPTNESPPSEELLEESTTPKDKKPFHSVDDLLEAAAEEKGKLAPPAKKVAHSSAENLTEVKKSKAPPPAPLKRPPKKAPKTPQKKAPEGGRMESSPEIPGIEIRELQGSPTSRKRRSPSTSDSDGRGSPSSPLDATWPRMGSSPRRKKEKDVFKFLKETDPNYTIRRQQLQMNLILEKNQHVKKGIETLMGVQLPDDIGEWVCDGVVLCEVVNRLHPGLIPNINRPSSGVPISRIKQTVNVSAFIDACKKLNIPQELLCSAGDIIEMRDPVRVINCLQRVLETKPGNLV